MKRLWPARTNRVVDGMLGIALALALAASPFALALADGPKAETSKSAAPPATAASPRYEQRAHHDPNGTGKFYMDREIAQVMGHRGAGWLERPERVSEEEPDQLISALNLNAGDKVADVGAGSGYFTIRLARAVGPEGKVYAVDIQPEMLAILKRRLEEEKLTNVELVLGTEADPKLPKDTLDLILMVDVYHEFSFPYEMGRAMADSLKVGGRMILVEYRKEDPAIPIKEIHKMSERQVLREMDALPLEWAGTSETLPRQHLLFFRKIGAQHGKTAPK